MTDRKPLTGEEINEILQVFIQAKKDAGQTVTFAYLLNGDDTKVLLDDREETDLN